MKKKIIIIFLIVLVVGLIAVYKNTTTKFGKNLTAQAIDTTAPVVSITTPLDGQVVSGSNVTVCVQATDASGIASMELRIGGLPAGGVTSPLCVNVNTTNFVNGFYQVFARATDVAGNVGTSGIITIATLNSTLPIISMTSPARSTTVNGHITLSAKAYSTVGIEKVEYLLDGYTTILSTVTTNTDDSYSYQWDSTTVSDGAHTIIARVTDVNGVSAVSSTLVNVLNTSNPDTLAPTVTLTAPTQGQTLSGTISLTASATDNVAVSGVHFFYNAILIGTATTTPYSVAWNTITNNTEGNGTYQITARAYDSAGNVGTSAPVGITIANTPSTTPVVQITSPSDGRLPSGSSVNFTATASHASGIASISLSINGSVVKRCTNTTTCTYRWNIRQVRGNRTLTATTTSRSGVTATVTKTVTR